MKQHIFRSLSLAFLAVLLPTWAFAQDGHRLTVTAKPTMAGTFNTNSATLEAGAMIHLYAYANNSFTFVQWTDESGTVVSEQMDFTYTMPDHDVQLIAEYEYNPANPANPARNYWNKELGEVIIDDFTTGSLQSAVKTAIGDSKAADVAMITVAGVMDNNDFGILNTYSACTMLDLSRVTGITQVPSYAFDYTKLESVYLPATTERIGTRAFYDCKQLAALTIYAMTPPVLESCVFTGVPEELVVCAPATAIAQYQNTDGWKDFTILPIQEDIRSLTVLLPNGANAADYAQMWLELTNTKSGQRMHYVMTDRTQYTFANIIRNTSWNITLRNERGDVFGQIDEVEVKDEDVSVVFTSLSKPQNISLSVVTPDGQDVTGKTQVTWTDGQGNYVAQGTSLTGLPIGYQLNYRLTLSQELAMVYNTPAEVAYTLKDGGNTITLQLSPISHITLSGKVKDATTGLALSRAIVSASQTFGGKYTKTVNAKTDNKGEYTLNIAAVPTSLAFAATDYISQTISFDHELSELNEFAVPDVSLKSITGATITVSFTYNTVDGETQNWYNDYQNVGYELFNVTKNHAISQYNVQYPQIVLLEEVEDGDVLRITATSRTNAFMPVESTATITDQMAETLFAIKELGKIQASFTTTGNASVVGSLYDASGKLMNTYNYSEASLTISNLADGQYTLVSMGSSRLFNTIYDLTQLPQTGLTEGTDYAQNTITVTSGAISKINIDEVPTLDESKLYYTGNNTSFMVNKPSIVAGNYLTLTGRIDFKSAYTTTVSNVQMIVDLPESCQFVENSVMVGNATSDYTLNGHQLTIPMTRYTDRVRFCVIPTLGGEYAPSAFVQFDFDGNTITQPIGSANYTAKNLSISAPSIVETTSIPISGTAVGTSTIEIYDNGVRIGQTTSLANGTWAATCELNRAYNRSRHYIYAKATTKNNLELISETKLCLYDQNFIEVKTVTMINTAHGPSSLALKEYVTEFDFQNPSTSIPSYWYWPNYPDFTFLINFTSNDTSKVSNVVLNVKTGNGNWTQLATIYDPQKNCWTASRAFNGSNNDIPKNVAVSYQIDSEVVYDTLRAADLQADILTIINEEDNNTELSVLEEQLDEELQKEEVNWNSVNTIVAKITEYRKPMDVSELNEAKSLYESLTNCYSGEVGTFVEQYTGELYLQTKETTGMDWSNFKDLDTTIPAGTYEYKDEKTGNLTTITVEHATNFSRDISKFEYDDKKSKKDGEIVLKNRDTGKTISIITSETIPVPQDITTSENYKSTMQEIWDFIGYNNGELAFSTSTDLVKEYVMRGLNNIDNALFTAFIESIEKTTTCTAEEYAENLAKSRMIADRIRINRNVTRTIDVGSRILSWISTARTTYNDIHQYFDDENNWENMIGQLYQLCSNDAAKELEKQAREYQQEIRSKNLRMGLGNATVAVATALGSGFTGASFGTSLLLVGASALAGWGMQHYADCIERDNKRNISTFKQAINSNANCRPYSEKPDNWHEHTGAEVEALIDPSGYVYEAVSTNRVEGVIATAFYKELVEDMYGDLHEKIVKWDASEYAQENPLITDENGMYAWDVPQGLWQVKFEKEGYETTYSEWLPVPPPQLDVNIAMKQNVQPNVKLARAYEDAVEVEFDKYMMPELLTTDNVMVMQNNSPVEGTIELLNEEVTYEGATETFASKIRFNAAAPFEDNEVTLLVNNRVKSYAGIRMQDDFSQTFAIEPEIKQIKSDSLVVVGYGGTATLTVSVLPASASQGKTLYVKTSSPMILGVETEQVVIGNDGKAEITISGELPGTAALTFSVEGTNLTGLTIASVELMANKTVATPTASIASGSVVNRGTAVELSCETEGATIYYTTDGSCPCDETGSRKVYDGTPIIINKTMTIKAMAVAPDMTESDVAEFTYIVESIFVKGDVNEDGAVDIADVVAVYNIMAGNNTNGFYGDVNNDGATDIADVVAIYNIMAGGK